jgi:hypothetical protein
LEREKNRTVGQKDQHQLFSFIRSSKDVILHKFVPVGGIRSYCIIIRKIRLDLTERHRESSDCEGVTEVLVFSSVIS